MKRFLVIALLSAFLVACGGDDASKFVGQWVDSAPKPEAVEETGYLAGVSAMFESSNDVSIESAGKNKVFVTIDIFGEEYKQVYEVVKNSLVDEDGRVEFELTDGKLNFMDRNTVLNKKN